MRLLLLVAAVCLLASAEGRTQGRGTVQARRSLDIYYIDTDHGKAVLYVSPAGQSLLVDAGNAGNDNRDATRILAAMKEANVRVLDYLVISHYHGDHVGGAPGVINGIQIRQFIDHGAYTVQGQERGRAGFDAYVKLRATANASQARPGLRIPMGGITMTVLSSARELIDAALAGVPGAGAVNPLCADFAPRDDVRGVENDESVTIAAQYGSFRVVDAGDLIGNQEAALVCPRNLLGTADVMATTGHGQEFGNWPVLVHTVRPRIAVMNNGPTDKQGPTFKTYRSSPGFEDFWQTHASDAQKEENSAEQFIASLDTTPVHPGHYIKVSGMPDGSFTVTNSRNGFTKKYPPRGAGTN